MRRHVTSSSVECGGNNGNKSLSKSRRDDTATGLRGLRIYIYTIILYFKLSVRKYRYNIHYTPPLLTTCATTATCLDSATIL